MPGTVAACLVAMAEVRRPTRESRFILDRESGEDLLGRFIVASHAAGEPPLRLVVVVAHREAYTNARRAEVLRALSLVEIPEQQVRCLGIRDGEAGRRLSDVTSKLLHVLGELEPDVVLTHSYEGGHTDHDAAAFGVHMAIGILRRRHGSAPLVLELTSYHDKDGERSRGEFLPADVPECELVLGEEEREIKRRMFEAFDTQRDVVAPFPVDVERFRIAPRYLFTEPPHPGTLDYERRCVRLTGAEWRALADQALQMLRTRRERREVPRE